MTDEFKMIKCYSCADDSDFKELISEEGFVVHSSKEMIDRCRDHNHKFYEINPYKSKSEKNEDRIDLATFQIKGKYKFITLRQSDKILTYNGKIYSNSDAKSIIKEETEKIIYNCNEHDRVEVIKKIKAQTYTDIESFDKDPMQITLENGILDLEKTKLREHTPKHLSRILLPVSYIPSEYEIHHDTIFADIEKNLKDIQFWKFLKSSFTVDGFFKKNNFETTLEMMASTLVKKQIDDKAFMNLGGGDNGKGVFFAFIESMIGSDNVSHVTLQDIGDDRFMGAELDEKSANIFTDLEPNELRRAGKIKAITSGEGIQVQKKGKDPFALYPFCKLIFSCNRFPKTFDQTQGFFRRWIIILWERSFENDPERDVHLKEKLVSNQDEKDLVFSSMIHLAKYLIKNGKFTHSKDWKEIRTEWNANADPLDDFVSNYIIDSENDTPVREVYHFYKDIMIEKGENPLKIGQFGKAFAEYYDQDRVKTEGKTKRIWLNIELKRPIQASLGDFE